MKRIAILATLTLAADLISVDPSSAQTESRVTVDTIVASGFDAPVQLTHAGDETNRLFVVEQGGLIRIVTQGAVRPTPFLDLRDRISSGDERGLLGLAFHPLYQDNGRFFIYYTDRSGATVVARLSVSAAEPDIAVAASAETLLRVPQPFPNHNGGQLAFSPLDGYLYIGLGDGGSGNDPRNHGQNKNTMLGTILRIDVDSGAPFAVPPDNPFVGRDGADAIWAYGLRNPWRFSFNETGDLYIGDVGQNAWEEIDFQAAGTPGGLNFGWAIREGPCPRGRQQPCVDASPELTEPIAFYDRGRGASVTGGFVYRGSRFPALSGRYFYGDFISGRIWSLPPAGGASERVPRLELETSLGISSFGEDESGELYVVDYFGGEIHRLEDAVNAPVILAATIPDGFVGVPYFNAFSVLGGSPPFRFELAGGRLAPGLSGPEASAGTVSGTPTLAGTFGPCTVRVTDSRGTSSERALTHHIRLLSGQ